MERYFITIMEKDGSETYISPSGKDLGWPDFGDSHVYGYYDSRENAIASLNTDAEAVYDGKYEFVVVEKMKTGIHPWCMDGDRFWMRYDETLKQFIEVPEVAGLHICNWALG